MRLHRIAAAVSAMCLLLTAAVAQEKETLHIGAAISLSGPTGVWGQQNKNGLEMLISQLPDGKLAGYPVKLTVYDTESNSTKTTQLFRRLAENDGVQVIITGSNSGEGLAVVPLANELKVPTMNMGAAEAITSPVTPYIFGISPTDRIVVNHILGVAKKRNYKRIALLSSQDGFGQSGSGIARQLAPEYGIELVAAETFGPQDTDMTPQLLRVRQTKPDALLVWAGNPGPTIIAKTVKTMGLPFQTIVSYASAQFLFVQQTGDAATGMLTSAMKIIEPFSLSDTDPQKQLLVKFVNDYKAKYGALPDQTAGHATDAIAWLQSAIENTSGPLTRQRIRDGLEKAQFCAAAGCRAVTPQDHRGLPPNSMALMEVKGGRWVAVEP